MNHSLSLFTALGVGIVLGILLEKQYNFDFTLNTGNSAGSGSKPATRSNGGLYNKSGSYQDQSKSGKKKGLTEESKTGNVE